MAEVYLASSALIKEGYSGIRTIEQATRAGFDGVQLYLDNRYRNRIYCTLSQELLQSVRDEEQNFGVVLHLPDSLKNGDTKAARSFGEVFTDLRAIYHYMPGKKLPYIPGVNVGWENLMTGAFYAHHVEDIKERVDKDRTFMAFDIGRLLYEDGYASPEQILTYIRVTIEGLDSSRDLLHVSDKVNWTASFREGMCVIGDGVCRELIPDIVKFNGVVVLEQEDLHVAVESLKVLKRDHS